jgi:hypothetical protein
MIATNLRSAVKKFGELLNLHSCVISDTKSTFVDYPTSESFCKIVPELEQLYVDEFFNPDERLCYMNYLGVKGRQLKAKHLQQQQIQIRNTYLIDNIHLSKKLKLFKSQLHLTLYGCTYKAAKFAYKSALQNSQAPLDFVDGRESTLTNNVDTLLLLTDGGGGDLLPTPCGETILELDTPFILPVVGIGENNCCGKQDNKNRENSGIFRGNNKKEGLTNSFVARRSGRQTSIISNSPHEATQIDANNAIHRSDDDGDTTGLLNLSDGSLKLPTYVTLMPPQEPQFITKQGQKRKRKATIKKVLQSIMDYKALTNKQKQFHMAYVKTKFNAFDIPSIRKWFEEEGFVAVSMVENVRNLTKIEQCVVNVFEDIEKRYARTLITDANRRLINRASGGKYSSIYTKWDDKRRAVSIAFDARTRSLQIMVEYYIQQFVHFGILHPNTKITNARGDFGVELLYKGVGLKGPQVAHYDFPQTDNSKHFLSYANSIDRSLPFDLQLDGGCSFFLNHKDIDETSGCPDGRTIVIPAFSFCILRGNLAHFGSGNTTEQPVFKFFAFLDPVEFERTTSSFRDVVFLFDEYQQFIRAGTPPHEVKIQTAIKPYYCAQCRDTSYYTYPLCKFCLQDKWHVTVSWKEEQKRFAYTYNGARALKPHHKFPDPFKHGIVRLEQFAIDFPVLQETRIGYVPLSQSHCAHFLDYKSVLATIKQDPDQFNVKTYFDGAFAWLMTCDTNIQPNDELILQSFVATTENMTSRVDLLIDVDEYAVRHILGVDDGDAHVQNNVPLVGKNETIDAAPTYMLNIDETLFGDDEEYCSSDSDSEQ